MLCCAEKLDLFYKSKGMQIKHNKGALTIRVSINRDTCIAQQVMMMSNFTQMQYWTVFVSRLESNR